MNWKFRSTWPANDVVHEFAQDFASRINELAGHRLKLEVLAAGTRSRCQQLLGWMKYGGGCDLHNERVGSIKTLNLVGFLTGKMPCLPLGWFIDKIEAAVISRA